MRALQNKPSNSPRSTPVRVGDAGLRHVQLSKSGDEDDAAERTEFAAISRKELIPQEQRRPYASPSGVVCVQFSCPDVFRLQIRHQSCHIWFPTDLTILNLDTSFDYMIGCVPTCPALAVALDASSLITLGQERRDERLLNAGKMRHVQSLQLLRNELNLPADRRNPGLISAITVFQIAEANISMSTYGNSWKQHARGVSLLAQSNNTEHSEHDGYQEVLKSNFFLFHFWAGIIDRRNIDGFCGPKATMLPLIAERVPGALEESDAACRQGANLQIEHASRVLQQLSALEQDLNSWSAAWNRSLRNAPFQLVEMAKTYPQYFALIDDKGSAKAFQHGMEFCSFNDAIEHLVCTASLLTLSWAMINVGTTLTMGPHQADADFTKRMSALRQKTTNCADTLCMGLTYLLKPEFGQFGFVAAVGPHHVASDWYQHQLETGHSSVMKKALWCDYVKECIKSRGLRPL